MDKTNLPPLPDKAAGYAAGCNQPLVWGQPLYTAEQMHEYAARAVREAVPGMVLVPMDPTKEMVEAGVMFGNSPNKAVIIYQSMVNAAPTQDQENGS